MEPVASLLVVAEAAIDVRKVAQSHGLVAAISDASDQRKRFLAPLPRGSELSHGVERVRGAVHRARLEARGAHGPRTAPRRLVESQRLSRLAQVLIEHGEIDEHERLSF